MKKIFFLIFVPLLFSCNSDLNKAIDYNNDLLEEYTQIGSELATYLSALQDDSKSHELNSMKTEILNNIEVSIEKIRNIENFNGNIRFKESTISVLKAYSNGIKNEYEVIAVYQNLPPEEKTLSRKLQAEKHAMHANESISQKEDVFIQMQKEFAKENNIDLD